MIAISSSKPSIPGSGSKLPTSSVCTLPSNQPLLEFDSEEDEAAQGHADRQINGTQRFGLEELLEKADIYHRHLETEYKDGHGEEERIGEETHFSKRVSQ